MAELNQKVADHEARLQKIEALLFPQEKVTNAESEKEEDLIGANSGKGKRKTNSDKKPTEIHNRPLPRINALGHDTGAALPLPGQEGAPKADDTESKVGMSANPEDIEKMNAEAQADIGEPVKTITTDEEELGEEEKTATEEVEVKKPKSKAEKDAAKAAKKASKKKA